MLRFEQPHGPADRILGIAERTGAGAETLDVEPIDPGERFSQPRTIETVADVARIVDRRDALRGDDRGELGAAPAEQRADAAAALGAYPRQPRGSGAALGPHEQ